MTIEYLLDFTAYLPQKQCPKLNEVQTLLNCSVTDLPRGNIIIQHQVGKFTLKVHDDKKGKALENKKVNYFLPGDSEGKFPIKVQIVKKTDRKRYVNPKYVNIWGTYDSEIGGFITNEALTKIYSEYGTIIVPVQDVFDLNENVWSIDKKNFRIDLDNGKHIPRNCPIEYTTKEGKLLKATLRTTYKDQPYFCRRCVEDHDGDCPMWLENRRRLKEIKEQKERDTKTLILGDSNLKQVNGNALLADVVASSGAKIGHLCNQLKHEKLDGYDNIVLFGGINNIPGPNENVDETATWNQISSEMNRLEKELKEQVKKGKHIYLTQVTNAKHTQTPRASKMRQKINREYITMTDRLRKCGEGKDPRVDIITWPVATKEGEYDTVKGLSEQSTISFIQKVDEKIGNGKLRATYLDSKLTAYQYSAVTSTYPLGCYKCTAMNHSSEKCPIDISKKRMASGDLDGPSVKVAAVNKAE